MQKRFIVAFSGLPGAGKDHMARVLVRQMGFTPIALALHFKLTAVVKEGLPFEEVFGSTKSPEVWEFLRLEGTERGRDVFESDIWIRYTDALARYYQGFGMDRFVIPDVRFPDEASWVRETGGRLIYLRGGKDDLPTGHASESHHDHLWTTADAVVDNRTRDPGAEVEVLYKVASWISRPCIF